MLIIYLFIDVAISIMTVIMMLVIIIIITDTMIFLTKPIIAVIIIGVGGYY